MKIGFIGAGKVGCCLGKLFCEKGLEVTGFYNRHKEGAIFASEFTNTAVFENASDVVLSSDAIFITVNDGNISGVFNDIKHCSLKGKYICHCSGALTAAQAFDKINETGATGYSIHPLFPVSDKLTSYGKLKDAFFCIEGTSEKGVELWRDILEKANLKVKHLQTDRKTTYHTACVFASNLVVGIIEKSLSFFEECSFTKEEAISALSPLITANINAILEKGPTAALTGPIERGDKMTVQHHLECLNNAEDITLYKVLSKEILKIAMKKNPQKDYTDIAKILEV